jgi:uncharacterized protein (DUF1697 family)
VSRAAILLRAVNVGGRRVAMADFKAALTTLGCTDVQTHLATGNAVATLADLDEAALEAGLTRELGGPVEVFVRTGPALVASVAANPYPQMARDDPSHLVVLFLKGEASADAIAALRAKIVGRETVAAGPGCVYACYPHNIGDSKLTAAVIERALGLRTTGRNWNTLTKLVALAAS